MIVGRTVLGRAGVAASLNRCLAAHPQVTSRRRGSGATPRRSPIKDWQIDS
jgi:hypothetical protein